MEILFRVLEGNGDEFVDEVLLIKDGDKLFRIEWLSGNRLKCA